MISTTTFYGIPLDEYGLALIRPETGVGIADMLHDCYGVLIGLTDEEGTHMDLLFMWSPESVGYNQQGFRDGYLFVTFFGFGGFGFQVGTESDVTYICEKLGYSRYDRTTTAQKIASLINNVRMELGKGPDDE